MRFEPRIHQVSQIRDDHVRDQTLIEPRFQVVIDELRLPAKAGRKHHQFGDADRVDGQPGVELLAEEPELEGEGESGLCEVVHTITVSLDLSLDIFGGLDEDFPSVVHKSKVAKVEVEIESFLSK